jgi:hypothetical protein
VRNYHGDMDFVDVDWDGDGDIERRGGKMKELIESELGVSKLEAKKQKKLCF